MLTQHTCPVCGNNQLREPPFTVNGPSFAICPVCTVEFGFDILHPQDKEGVQRARREWNTQLKQIREAFDVEWEKRE